MSKNNIFIFSLTIPSVTFGMYELDSFPFALIVALFILPLKDVSISKSSILVLIIAFIISTLGLLKDVNQFNLNLALRQFLNYASIIVCGELLRCITITYKDLLKVLTFSLFLNLSMGIAQILGFHLFVSNARVDTLRGAVGLFAEPTSLGLYAFCVFIVGIIIHRLSIEQEDKKRARNVIALALILLIFVSQSSTAILLLLCFFILKFVKFEFKIIALFAVFVIISIFTYEYWGGTRFGGIVKILLDKDVFYLLALDGSINERLSAVVGPFYGWFNHYFLPSSAFSYKETVLSLQQFSGGFFWYGGSNKIMNYLGTLIYEMSFLGLYIAFRYILPFNRSNFYPDLFVVWILFLLNGVPLSHGYVLLFVFCFQLKERKHRVNAY